MLTLLHALFFSWKERGERFLLSKDQRFILDKWQKYFKGIDPYKMVFGEYGETPFSVIEAINKMAPFSEFDYCVDLGCGRGKVLLFAYLAYKIAGIGVERNFSIGFHSDLFFSQEQMPIKIEIGKSQEVKIPKKSLVYLYGTMLSEEEIAFFAQYLRKNLGKEDRLVTVGYALPGFTVLAKRAVRYPWGKTTIYVQV